MSNQHNFPLIGQAQLGNKILSASTTLSGTDSGKAFVNTPAPGTITITLPKAAIGTRYIFVETSAHNMVIQPQAADAIRGSSAGVATTLSSLGSKLLLTCVTPGFWELF
jgi:hypothetical protein